jgi:5-methylcytosine-specific restriction endonuclease McrA
MGPLRGGWRAVDIGPRPESLPDSFAGLSGYATHVDHIVELEECGARYALSNLQAACGSCNTAKRNRRKAREKHGPREWWFSEGDPWWN